jgi:hypothetical protein
MVLCFAKVLGNSSWLHLFTGGFNKNFSALRFHRSKAETADLGIKWMQLRQRSVLLLNRWHR